MSYKISGTKSETSRVIIIKESDWSIESNTMVSGSGAYSVEDLETGNKLAFSRANDGEIVGYGAVAAEEIVVAGKTLWTFGYNSYSELGQENQTHLSSPTQVGVLTDWDKIYSNSSSSFTMTIKSDGTLWTWGKNAAGQLGLGDQIQRSSPTQVGLLTDWSSANCGYEFTMVIKADGTLWGWGKNSNYKLGLGVTTNYSSPVQIGVATTWNQVDAGSYNHTVGTQLDGTLWSWGGNEYGCLGLGGGGERTSPTQIGALTNWSEVVSGLHNALAIKTDNTLWTWGKNDYGQLGLGDQTPRNSPVQVGGLSNWSQVSGGAFHTVAVKTDGTLWSWGRNDIGGQLGLGDTDHRSSPVQVGGLSDWSKVAVGSYHSLAIKTDGTLWAWGDNRFGHLGLGDITDSSSPVQIGSSTDWNSVVGGTYHTAALKG